MLAGFVQLPDEPSTQVNWQTQVPSNGSEHHIMLSECCKSVVTRIIACWVTLAMHVHVHRAMGWALATARRRLDSRCWQCPHEGSAQCSHRATDEPLPHQEVEQRRI